MKFPLLKSNGSLAATLAILLFIPALTRAATVIDHVPYTITASGHYELQTDFIIGATEKPFGITVKAANVSIDLNGFTLAHKNLDPSDPLGTGIQLDADNVSVRNGTISGFRWGVLLAGSQCKVQDLTVLGNEVGVLVESEHLSPLSNNAVVNCLIVGLGATGDSQNTGIGVSSLSGDVSGVLIKGNQVSDCKIGIGSGSPHGNAIIHNYVANSGIGLGLSDHDFYQGNVVTNCKIAFNGGHAIGTENGGD